MNKENLKLFLQDNIENFRADRPLHEQIDSIQIVTLILQLETKTGKKFDLDIFSKKTLSSIDSLLFYLENF